MAVKDRERPRKALASQVAAKAHLKAQLSVSVPGGDCMCAGAKYPKSALLELVACAIKHAE